MKKICSLLVIFLLFLFLAPQSLAFSDITPPKLHTVGIEKSKMQAGERNAVIMKITDDISGVETVIAHVRSISGKQQESSIAKYQENDNWRAEFEVSEYAETGEWYVDAISVEDKAGNQKFYRSGIDFNVRFNVENVYSDVTPPTLHTTVIERSEMQAGERNAVKMKITDDISGVKTVIAHVRSISGKQQESSIAKYQENDNWRAEFEVSEYAEMGEWYVEAISVEDKAGNQKFYRNGIDFNVRFNVENVHSDVTPPTLHTTDIERSEMQAGERNAVKMKITDDISGVETVIAHVRSISGKQQESSIAKYQENDNWRAEFEVSEYAEMGEWYVEAISVEDKAGNQKFYRSGIDFNVNFTVGKPTVRSVLLLNKHINSFTNNNTINFEAISEGSRNAEYRFLIRDKDGRLQTLKDYSSESIANWTPVIPGEYELIVHGKDKNATGEGLFHEARDSFRFTINREIVNSVSLDSNQKEAVRVGSSIRFTASSTGSLNSEYRYMLRDQKGKVTTLSDYKSNPTLNWVPDTPGEYELIVHAKDRFGQKTGTFNDARDSLKIKVVEHETVTGVDLDSNHTSDMPVGSKVTFNASSSGSHNAEYRFIVREQSGKLTTLQEYSNNNKISWSPDKSGQYEIVVHAKDKYSTGHSTFHEARASMKVSFTDKETVSEVSILGDLKDIQRIGTNVNFEAKSKGSRNAEYRFIVRDRTGKLTTIQEYSNKSTVIWSPSEPGRYEVIVHAKDKFSSGTGTFHEARSSVIYNFVEKETVKSVVLSGNKDKNQQVGTEVIFTAEASGSSQTEYRFIVRDQTGKLTTIQEYSENKTITWTPVKQGRYEVIVHAKDRLSTGPGLFNEARASVEYIFTESVYTKDSVKIEEQDIKEEDEAISDDPINESVEEVIEEDAPLLEEVESNVDEDEEIKLIDEGKVEEDFNGNNELNEN
ncbi:triple tyrosine motif-containing protein [Shouchella hunanensis]|uniref:Triple tyrosine motif-containing protein n=1 Tax=Shouchella hunanensis TaxID=766894 RepID=A0ABY7W871_9BACI|nr:triple tyrosine motif-containing protein [Shouchella hunanensis]WDF04893.1 triple tyrosine motif-containing protein [Shouchella hunanensis]